MTQAVYMNVNVYIYYVMQIVGTYYTLLPIGKHIYTYYTVIRHRQVYKILGMCSNRQCCPILYILLQVQRKNVLSAVSMKLTMRVISIILYVCMYVYTYVEYMGNIRYQRTTPAQIKYLGSALNSYVPTPFSPFTDTLGRMYRYSRSLLGMKR